MEMIDGLEVIFNRMICQYLKEFFCNHITEAVSAWADRSAGTDVEVL